MESPRVFPVRKWNGKRRLSVPRINLASAADLISNLDNTSICFNIRPISQPVQARPLSSSLPSLRLQELLNHRLQNRLIEQSGLSEADLPFFGDVNARGAAPNELQFSSYDYLALKRHPEVVSAAQQALAEDGLSTSASRVVAGECPFHHSLERALAANYQQDAALAFVSGHATNVSTIAALMERGDLVVHDRLAHNSCQMGVRLSGAKGLSFAHNDLDDLERQLNRQRSHFRRCLIITEGLFSMDGDSPDLQRLLVIKQRFDAFLMVDEAHSLGVLGARGQGSHEAQGIDPQQVELWMGTLSKTLGSTGGFIAASAEVIHHLRTNAPGFTYSVGLNAPCCAAAETALALIHREPERLERLRTNSSHAMNRCLQAGLELGTCTGSAIIPIITHDIRATVLISKHLRHRGLEIYPLVYPSVPMNDGRLRMFIRADHTCEEIDKAVAMIAEAITDYFASP